MMIKIPVYFDIFTEAAGLSIIIEMSLLRNIIQAWLLIPEKKYPRETRAAMVMWSFICHQNRLIKKISVFNARHFVPYVFCPLL